MFKTYLPEYNPNNLTGQVGGTVSSLALSGYIDELFPYVSAPPTGSNEVFVQYRKVFIKNEYETDSSTTRVWIEGAEHLNQISVGIGGASDTISSATGIPSVSIWATPTSYSNGLEIGTIAANTASGIWLRQTLSGIVNPDPYVTFRLYIGGRLEE